MSPSILITDDDAALRQTLGCMLEPLGYQVQLASDGEEAVTMVTRGGIHLLLCDNHMPRLTGIETIQRIRQLDRRFPCILMSGELDETIQRQALELAAFSVLAKPVTRQLLRQVVQQALQVTYGWPMQ